MNTIKRITQGALAAAMLLALGLVTLPLAVAAEGQDNTLQSALQAQREHMWQMGNVMHYAAFTAQPTDSGVTVQVTSTDATVTAAIREEFGEHHVPVTPLANSAVKAEEVQGGIALVFTSTDPAVVTQLQGYGTSLVYTMLRNSMHATMVALGAGSGYGPGMMGGQGYGPGPGYGPGNGRGMMDGQGYGPGYGRGMGGGMMGGSGYGPGNGRGMMGGSGYGPGWMHGGQGYGPGATPQAPVDNGK